MSRLHSVLCRVVAEDGTVAGLAFQATTRYVLTCAHVVAAARGVSPKQKTPPAGELTLEFPFVSPCRTRHARVRRWQPLRPAALATPEGASGVAVLELLDEAPAAAPAVPLVLLDEPHAGPARAASAGQASEAVARWRYHTLRPDPTTPWLPLDPQWPEGITGELDCSGSPLWDPGQGGVLGMVITMPTGPAAGRPFLIPAPLLIRACPELAAHARPACPYPGLAPFGEEQAACFFGREQASEQLAQAVSRRPLVALVAPAGSGKSSVVAAGLAPRLRRDDWLVAAFRPGLDPFRALATALFPLLDLNLEAARRDAAIQLLTERLQANTLSLREVLARVPRHPADRRVLVVADQFEEIYQHVVPEARKAFLDRLLAAVCPIEGATPGQPTLLLVLQAAILEQALAHPPLARALGDATLLLPPLAGAELGRAIAGPATSQGVQLEAGLLDRLVRDLEAGRGELPRLGFLLRQLWQERSDGTLTLAAYEEMGGLAGALRHQAERLYHTLGEDEQARSRALFLRLVQPQAEGRYARRRLFRSEVDAPTWAVAEQLARAGLLRLRRHDRSGQPTVEIAHPTLIEAWSRLADWLAEEAAFQRWAARLREARHRWEQGDLPENAPRVAALLAEGAILSATSLQGLDGADRAFWERLQARQELARRPPALPPPPAPPARLAGRRGGQPRAGWVAALLLLLLAAWGGWQYRQAQSSRVALLVEQERGSQARVAAQATADAQARTLAQARATVAAMDGTTATLRAAAERHRRQAQARRLAALVPHELADTGGTERALLLAAESLHRTPTLEGDQAARQGLSLIPHLMGTATHNEPVGALTFHPDGRLLAAVQRGDRLELHELAAGRLAGALPLAEEVSSLHFSPDGSLLATLRADNTVQVWEWATARLLHTLPPRASVHQLRFNLSGRWLAVAGGDGLRVWNLADGAEVAGLRRTEQVHDVAFSPDGRWLATADAAGATLWEIPSGARLAQPVQAEHVGGVAFSPDGRWLAVGSIGVARVVDLATGEVHSQMIQGLLVQTLVFSPTTRQLLTASVSPHGGGGPARDTLRVWDVGSGAQLAHLAVPGPMAHVTFSSDGRKLAVTSGNGEQTVTTLWDLRATETEKLHAEHAGWVWAVAAHPQGTLLATGTSFGGAVLWETEQGRVTRKVASEAGDVWAVAFNPDGQWLATGSSQRAALWDVSTGLMLASFAHEGNVWSVAFSPDGRLLATGSSEGRVQLWDTASGQTFWGAQPNPTEDTIGGNHVWDVAFSPDGRWLATAGSDGQVRLWEVATGREEARLTHTNAEDCHDVYGREVWAVAFSPDGRWLASGGSNCVARVWNVETGRPVAWLSHELPVWDVAFSPDGQWLATASDEWVRGANAEWGWWNTAALKRAGYVELVPLGENALGRTRHGRWLSFQDGRGVARVWDTASWQEAARVSHPRSLWSVAFGPNSRWLATGSADRTARAWLLLPDDLIEAICTSVARNLAPDEWQRLLPHEGYRPTCPGFPGTPPPG